MFSACKNGDSAKTEQLAQGEMYICSMHPEVMSEKPGKCPKCKMNLEKKMMTEDQKKMMEAGSYVKPE